MARAKESIQTNTTNPATPSAGFFDRIISVITQEQEFKKTKKILWLFMTLLVVSIISIPFSFLYVVSQWKHSGIDYFISTAMENMTVFTKLWQDFSLSILESLPVVGLTLFALNLALAVFTLRLFLHRKGLLLTYVKHRFI